MGRLLSLGLVLSLALAALPAVWGIEEQCSACMSIAYNLQKRLEKEKPRNHIDLRHRLDKDGKRYGKVIEYKMSELRAIELLETLCEEVGPSYCLATFDTDRTGAGGSMRGWARVKGFNKTLSSLGGNRPERAEELMQNKELTNYCAKVMDKHEDEIVEALRSEEIAADWGVEEVLCERITKQCTPGETEVRNRQMAEIIERRRKTQEIESAALKAAQAAADEKQAADTAAEGEAAAAAAEGEGDAAVKDAGSPEDGSGSDESSSSSSSDEL